MENKIDDTNEDVYLAKWIAGEISDAELKNLVTVQDFIAYQKIKVGITIFEQLEKPLDATFKKVNEKINLSIETKPKAKTFNLYTKITIAVAAAILLFLSINIFFGNQTEIHQTAYGEQKTIKLLDNSEVVLNAKSELSYNKKNWATQREVKLNGEAFFKVKKGSQFTVITDKGNITVLGTQFNVNASADFFEVVCYSGKVKVVSNQSEYLLLPNQSVRLVNGIFANQKAIDLLQQPSWLNGESSFKSVPLKQVILALQNQFNIKIDAKNIDSSTVFTGSFNHKNLNIALASVFKTVQIKYTLSNNKVTLSQ
jgi:transmembrane sensor